MTSPVCSNATQPLEYDDQGNTFYDFNPYFHGAKRAKLDLGILDYTVPSRQNSYHLPKSPSLESLPDLTADENTPLSSPVHINHKYVFLPDVPTSKTNVFAQLVAAKNPTPFEIPELVHKIVKYVEQTSVKLPQELTPVRRKPLSLKHAFLIHGDKDLALQAMVQDPHQPETREQGVLFNLLQVNHLFKDITLNILYEKLFFDDEVKFLNFIRFLRTRDISLPKLQPKLFILHKLYTVKQSAVRVLTDHIDFSRCEWLEIYMCPKIYPSVDFLSPQLRKIVITGSKRLDDEFLIKVSQICLKLQVLDVRACELISDSGIYHVGSRCNQLQNINVGRKNKGSLVTDISVTKLIRNNPNLTTVGLAGCYISDKTLWDLAIYCSESLTRLSINNCPLVTNQSIPVILQNNFYWPNLSVLELRFVYKITEFKPLIEFKRRQEYKGVSPLFEVCEELMIRWRQQELEMDKLISDRIFLDILTWVNLTDDDTNFEDVHDLRRKIRHT